MTGGSASDGCALRPPARPPGGPAAARLLAVRPRRLRARAPLFGRIRCAPTSTSSRARSASGYGFSETLVKIDPAAAHRARGGGAGADLADQRRRRGPALHRRAVRHVGARCTWRTGRAWPLLAVMALLGFARRRRVGGHRRRAARAGLGQRDDLHAAAELRGDPARELRRLRPVEGPGGRQLPADRRRSPTPRSCPRARAAGCTWGSLLGLLAVAAFAFVVARTRWGLEMRAIGGNVEAARRLGLPITAT